jgi:hypothetical protein
VTAPKSIGATTARCEFYADKGVLMALREMSRLIEIEARIGLGHKNIQHTVRYTQLAAGRFKKFWQD